jgi:hypothetical protein
LLRAAVVMVVSSSMVGMTMAGRAVFLDAIDMVGGVNAFSRYENGKIKPPLALVNWLKVLDRHPDLLSEVRAG